MKFFCFKQMPCLADKCCKMDAQLGNDGSTFSEAYFFYEELINQIKHVLSLKNIANLDLDEKKELFARKSVKKPTDPLELMIQKRMNKLSMDDKVSEPPTPRAKRKKLSSSVKMELSSSDSEENIDYKKSGEM